MTGLGPRSGIPIRPSSTERPTAEGRKDGSLKTKQGEWRYATLLVCLFRLLMHECACCIAI